MWLDTNSRAVNIYVLFSDFQSFLVSKFQCPYNFTAIIIFDKNEGHLRWSWFELPKKEKNKDFTSYSVLGFMVLATSRYHSNTDQSGHLEGLNSKCSKFNMFLTPWTEGKLPAYFQWDGF